MQAGEFTAEMTPVEVTERSVNLETAEVTATTRTGFGAHHTGGVAARSEPRLADLRSQEVVRVELGARLLHRRALA